MKSSAVQAVVRSYRRLGVMGLVDAPRSGRPTEANRPEMLREARQSSARAAGAAHEVSADTVWRRARLAGLSIERSNGRNRPVPPCKAAPSVVGIYSDDSTAVVLLATRAAIEEHMRPMGSCHSADARRERAVEGAASRDWLQALQELRATPGTAPTRARSETQLWFAQRAEKLVDGGAALTVVLGGDPTASAFVRWLGVFRRLLQQEHTAKRMVQLICAAQPAQWHQALERQGAAQSPGLLAWPGPGARPFAWCRSVRGKSGLESS